MSHFAVAAGKRFAHAAVCAVAGCAQPLETPPLTAPDAALDGGLEQADEDAGLASEAGAACRTGDVQRCVCGVGDGSVPTEGARRCDNAVFGACVCGDASSARDPGSDCKPGVYRGDVMGSYVSDLSLLGLPGMVEAADAMQKAIQFTLQAPSANDGIFSVLDGTFHAAVAGAFTMDGTVTGVLRCDSKTFSGTLQGSYAVLGQRRTFEGPLTANYDGARSSFVQGTWDLAETTGTGTSGNSGSGKGSWEASAQAGAVSP